MRVRDGLLGALALCAGTAALGLAVTHVAGRPLASALGHWDSNWYADIIENGRGLATSPEATARWAFLPLYLGAVALVRSVVPDVAIAGAAVSVLALLGAVSVILRAGRDELGAPATRWGLMALLLSPASYSLVTCHTEATFLLLSAVALTGARSGRVAMPALAVVLALWTRNQGVVLAAVTCVTLWTSARRAGAAVVAGAAMASYTALLGYAWYRAGTPWAFYLAQQGWDHVSSLGELLGGLVMANEEAPLAAPWLARHLFAVGWGVTTVWLFRAGRRLAALYTGLSLVPVILQGNAHNAFRFAAVVYPALFALGDALAARPAWVRWLLGGAWLALTVWTARSFFLDGWAY